MDDSVPVTTQDGGKASGKNGARTANLGALLTLFVLFLFVVSDFFTDSVISGFGEKAVKGRHPTCWGVVLQGIFLVILFALASHLTENGVF
jgi:hypothetical protein